MIWKLRLCRRRPRAIGGGVRPCRRADRAGQAVPGGDDLHRDPGHRAERRRRQGDRGIDHQARRRDSRLPADPARHRARAIRRPRAVERIQPRALVREILRQRQGSAERRRHRRHRADGHLRRALYRQAQPACLDVACERADLCREYPQGAGQVRPEECRHLQQECRRLCRQDQGDRRAAAQAAVDDPGRSALAGLERRRLQLSDPRLQPAAKPISGRSMPTNRARPSRCAR